MTLITYVPASGYDSSEHGIVNAGGGTSFDVGAALVAGGGQFTVDDTVNSSLVSVLDRYPGVVRSGTAPSPPVVVDSLTPVIAHTKGAATGDLLVRGTDGNFAPTQKLVEKQLPSSVFPPLLRWAPPQLEAPIVQVVDHSTDWYPLNPNQDYILQLSSTAKVQPAGSSGMAQILGGRNLVLIGGTIDISGGSTAPNQSAGRALYFNGQTGIVHIEGLYVSGGNFAEGVDIYSPEAIFQLVNCRMDGLPADNGAIHPQFIAPYAGYKELRVDRFTGSTAYQGFQLALTSGGPFGPTTLRRVNIVQNPGSAQASTQVLWVGRNDGPVTLKDFYIQPRGNDALVSTVMPSQSFGDAAQRPFVNPDGSVQWPAKAGVSGKVMLGSPPSGDFAAAGGATGGGPDKPGFGYVSPGYDDPTSSSIVVNTIPNLIPNVISAASYTFGWDDQNQVTEFTSATAVTATIPPNSSVAYPIGAIIRLSQQGAGVVTVAAGAGVTVRGTLTTSGLSTTLAFRQRAANEWTPV